MIRINPYRLAIWGAVVLLTETILGGLTLSEVGWGEKTLHVFWMSNVVMLVVPSIAVAAGLIGYGFVWLADKSAEWKLRETRHRKALDGGAGGPIEGQERTLVR